MVVHRGRTNPFGGLGSLHGSDCACCPPGGTKAIGSVTLPLPLESRLAFLLVARRHEVRLPQELASKIFELSASKQWRTITRPAAPPPRRAKDAGSAEELGRAMGMLWCDDAPP